MLLLLASSSIVMAQDCDGLVDEGMMTFYIDADSDGFGGGNSITSCSPTGDYTATRSGDCDDNNPMVNPVNCFNQELLEYFGIGDYDNALLTAMKSVEFADNNFKGLDAQMALAYNNLGFVHFTMDNHEEAERAYIQALQIWEENLGSDHPNVGASLNNLAALYEKAGSYKQAEKYKNRSKEIWQKAQEDASSKLADICDSMTEILFVCPTDNKK